MEIISPKCSTPDPEYSSNFGTFCNEIFREQYIMYLPQTEINLSSTQLSQTLEAEHEHIKIKESQLENETQTSSVQLKPLISDDFTICTGPNNEKRYGCKDCEFTTKHKVSLYRHRKLHNPEDLKMYKCDFCSFQTHYKRHFDVHITVLHKSDDSKGKQYKCDKCSYKSDYRENLTRHKKIHLAPEDRNSFICDLCGFESFYRKSYRVHMEMIHQMVTSGQNEEAEFKCYHCPFETRYRVNIVRHLKTHMKGNTQIYKCADCNFQTIHKTNYNTHVLKHKDPGKIKIYECQHCPHKTFYKASLRNHLKLHMKKEEIETFKCDICDFATIYERSLKLHVLYMHNGDHQAIEYFKCHFCDFETRYKENWRRHEKNHSRPGRQENYNCEQCSFSTIQQGRYERHLLTHSANEQLTDLGRPKKRSPGVKRFRNVIDTPTFNQTEEDDFKRQKFSDGGPEEFTMFQCCRCAFKTLSEEFLKNHLKKHDATITNIPKNYAPVPEQKPDDKTPESVENNKVESAPASHNEISLDIKKTGKEFECDYCTFKTIHRSSIRRHRETHLKPNERKVFKCPTCFFHSFTRARVNSHECPNRKLDVSI